MSCVAAAGADVVKTFFFIVTDAAEKKLFVPDKVFQVGVMFANKTGAYPSAVLLVGLGNIWRTRETCKRQLILASL